MFYHQAGLTLIEIMVTMAVAIIVLTVAVPNYVAFTRANKLTTQVNSFVQALHLARNEAVRAGGATLCASNDQLKCTEDGDWLTGWIIFADYDADGTMDSGEELIRTGDAFPGGYDITADSLMAVFGRMGFNVTTDDPAPPLNFIICNGRVGEGTGRKISINRAGRPSTEIYDCK